ncbi:membrane protein [Streptomyces sp. SPB074]|nr:membrane protein [Streptomyces sp. SPB074]
MPAIRPQSPPPPAYGYPPPPPAYGYPQQSGPGKAPPPAAYGNGHGNGGYDDGGYDNGYDKSARGGGGNRNKGLLIAIGGVCVVALGLGLGALYGGGGDDGDEAKTSPVSATASETRQNGDGAKGDKKSERPSPSADPVKEQAVGLDKLLADSNNSRDAVVRSVGNIGGCKDLGKAAADLRDAARQRNELVKRLGQLPVDKLPRQDELKSALARAWKASATADNHYAAWADQTGKHGGCPGGHARSTNQRNAGDRASGQATSAKEQASGLWNEIATKYELTKRDKSQL